MKRLSTPTEVLNQGYALVDLGDGLPPARIYLEPVAGAEGDPAEQIDQQLATYRENA